MSFPRTRQWAGRAFSSSVLSRSLPPQGRVFSGIQPTGVIHLGNYLGAIKNWVLLQEESLAAGPPVFCVVDLHSLTTDEGRSNLRGNVLMTTSALLACGVDPKKSILYNQSQVRRYDTFSFDSRLGPLSRRAELDPQLYYSVAYAQHHDTVQREGEDGQGSACRLV